MAKGDFTISVQGAAKLEANLAKLGSEGRSALKIVLRNAAKVVQNQARANIHRGKDITRKGVVHKGGTLQKAIKVRSSSKGGKVAAFVGTNSRDNLFGGETFYAGFVEFGHKLGRRKLGASRRDVPAHPFLSLAVKQKRSQIEDVIERQFAWQLHKRGIS